MSASFAEAIAAFEPALPIAVAFSGGADSTALLTACSDKWPGQVRAIHIHHGVQAAADDFERHCQSTCAALKVPLLIKRVDGRHVRGQSPEEAARRVRYEALDSITSTPLNGAPIRSVAIAQHADDQAETLLLALSRGSGLPGLSAMPAQWERAGIVYHRPLLTVRAADIRAWLQVRGVACIEDPTNVDESFTRNAIRAKVLPVLDKVFPHFRDTFARSAAHAAQAQTVLLEVARQDLALLGEPPVIANIQLLSRARQANVLRYWFNTTHKVTPSTAQLEELLNQIQACTTRGQQIRIKVANGLAVRQGASLHWYNA